MNHTPKTLVPTALLGSRALGGARQLAGRLDLKACTAETIAADFYEFDGNPGDPTATPPIPPTNGKQTLYLMARAAHAEARAQRREAEQAARTFIARAVDTLKGFLGRRWNTRWVAVGFTNGSLALSGDALPLIRGLRSFYGAHPEYEVEALELTAARAEQFRQALVDARTAVDRAHADEAAAKQARDVAWQRLRSRLRLLREELTSLLSPDDSRWYAFGFRRPADGETPDLVEKVELRPAGENTVLVQWPRARLAENYRVAWKPSASADAPVELPLATDRQALIGGVPPGVEIIVFVSPRNSAGERKPTTATIVG